MEFLKELFEKGALSWEQFTQAVNDKGFKVADLSKGDYVGKKKYEDELASRDTTITDLNGQITTRDNDLANLKAELEKSSSTEQLDALNGQITTLQSQYNTAKTEFEQKLAKQSYEFAVKEFANSKKFTSQAARRDFINEMLKEDLKIKDNKIQGAEDFVTSYSTANADAFLVEKAEPEPPKPTFIAPPNPKGNTDENPFTFNFSGVRPQQKE